jgi:hypothetical protein
MAIGSATNAAAQPDPAPETVYVIGTPLGERVDRTQVDANVQTATAEQIREQGALDRWSRRRFRAFATFAACRRASSTDAGTTRSGSRTRPFSPRSNWTRSSGPRGWM